MTPAMPAEVVCQRCHGRGVYRVGCTLCGDPRNEYHWCNDELRACPDCQSRATEEPTA